MKLSPRIYLYTLLLLNITDSFFYRKSLEPEIASGIIIRYQLDAVWLEHPTSFSLHSHFWRKVDEKCLRASQTEFTRGNADGKQGELDYRMCPIRFPQIHDIIPLSSTIKR